MTPIAEAIVQFEFCNLKFKSAPNNRRSKIRMLNAVLKPCIARGTMINVQQSKSTSGSEKSSVERTSLRG
ncbi:unnamed protein product [Lathyrus oleraceus]